MAKMGKKKNLSAFTTILFSAIKIYFALSFCCHNNKKEIIAYFKNLVQTRVREFIKLYPPKHPHKKISINLKRIIYLLRNSQIKMRNVKRGLMLYRRERKKKKRIKMYLHSPPPLNHLFNLNKNRKGFSFSFCLENQKARTERTSFSLKQSLDWGRIE